MGWFGVGGGGGLGLFVGRIPGGDSELLLHPKAAEIFRPPRNTGVLRSTHRVLHTTTISSRTELDFKLFQKVLIMFPLLMLDMAVLMKY